MGIYAHMRHVINTTHVDERVTRQLEELCVQVVLPEARLDGIHTPVGVRDLDLKAVSLAATDALGEDGQGPHADGEVDGKDVVHCHVGKQQFAGLVVERHLGLRHVKVVGKMTLACNLACRDKERHDDC